MHQGDVAVMAAAALLLIAGCTTTDPAFSWGRKPQQQLTTDEIQPATASAPATQTQPVEATASQPADPAQQLTQEVQQYVSNLPMDDLQTKLARRDGQPAPAGVLSSQGSISSADPQPAEPALKPAEAVAPAPPVATEVATPPAQPPAPQPAVSAAQMQEPYQVPLEPEIIEPAVPSPAELATPSVAEAPRPVEPTAQPQDTRIVDIEISPAAAASAAPKEDTAGKQQPNQASSVVANAGSSAGDLKDLLEQLRKEAASRPGSVGAALRLRLAEWSLNNQAAPQDWSLQDVEKRNLADSVWQVLQVVCRADGLSQRSSGEEFEKALESLSETLRQVQPLKIPNAALCWSVENFGHYESLPSPWKFPAGQTSMVVLYCELAGFRSEACTDKPGWHRTLLGERLAILTPEGKELWSYDEPGIEDLCRRPRRDFFVTKKLRIPGNLPTGPYVLKVTIRDLLANRVTETNVPFEIESVAATR
jgi:hypothetical protein